MKNCFSRRLIMILVSVSLFLAISAQSTYAWFTDSLRGTMTFKSAEVLGELSSRSFNETEENADDSPVIKLGKWTYDSVGKLFVLYNAISACEEQEDRNNAFSEWLSDSGIAATDFEDVPEPNVIYENDVVSMRVVLQNHSDIPVYFRIKLNDVSDGFEAAYAVSVYELFADGEPKDDEGPFGEPSASLRYAEYIDKNGETDGWFYCETPLYPPENDSMEYDEYAIWIHAYIINGSPVNTINFGDPVVEIIQAGIESASTLGGWKEVADIVELGSVEDGDPIEPHGN